MQNVYKKKMKEPLATWIPYLMKTISGSFNGGFNLLR